MTGEPVKWLLVGAGDIATRRAGPALVRAPHSALVAVCDLAPERAARLAEALGAQRHYADLDRALAECGAEAVYLATPQNTHYELSLKVLQAGKHLLCEKPLGLNGAQCLKLLRAASRTDRVASCSNYRRLSEQYRVTASLLQRGEIGRLTGGWAVYSSPFYNPGGQPICQANGSSRIKELGYYLIDIAHNFFGFPSGVLAGAGINRPQLMNDVEDIAAVILQFPGGAVFTIIFNCTSPGTRHELELFGDRGRIYWPQWPPHGNGPVYKIAADGRTEEHAARTDDNYHLPMIEDYVAALRTGRTPVCTLESATKTEVITDAVFRSLGSGRLEPVVWEEDETCAFS